MRSEPGDGSPTHRPDVDIADNQYKGDLIFFQSVGWMPVDPIEGLRSPYWLGLWFGVFPTWQSVGLQIGAAAFVIGSYVLAEYLKGRTGSRRRGRRADRRRVNHLT